MGDTLDYTNLYDLMCAVAEREPDAYIETECLEHPHYTNIWLKSSLFPQRLGKASALDVALFGVISNTLDILPHATTDFVIEKLRFSEEELTGQIHWIICSNCLWAEEDILRGEHDVWGEPVTVHGIADFESVRDTLNKWGMVDFELELTEAGWKKAEVSLKNSGEKVELDAALEQRIVDNLSGLEEVLLERMKMLAQRVVERVIGPDTERFHFAWNIDGGAVMLDDEWDNTIATSKYTVDVYDRLNVETCKMLFNVELDEPLSLPVICKQ